jgi:serine/threonine protein kinase
MIGKGSFSTVYLGKSNITGETVAIKVINLSSLNADTYQKLQYELAILKSLPSHPNIVKMHKLLQTVHNVYIVT